MFKLPTLKKKKPTKQNSIENDFKRLCSGPPVSNDPLTKYGDINVDGIVHQISTIRRDKKFTINSPEYASFITQYGFSLKIKKNQSMNIFLSRRDKSSLNNSFGFFFSIPPAFSYTSLFICLSVLQFNVMSIIRIDRLVNFKRFIQFLKRNYSKLYDLFLFKFHDEKRLLIF